MKIRYLGKLLTRTKQGCTKCGRVGGTETSIQFQYDVALPSGTFKSFIRGGVYSIDTQKDVDYLLRQTNPDGSHVFQELG